MDINQTPQTNRPIDGDSAPTGATDAAITTWLDTYRPRGKATRVWSQHCDLIKPWIAACSSDGVDEARRNAGTFLNYLAWALDQADSIEDCLSEDMFDRFCEENPAGLTDGSFAHARRRCEKVLAARATYLTAASVSPTEQIEAAEPTPATNAPAATAATTAVAEAASLDKVAVSGPDASIEDRRGRGADDTEECAAKWAATYSPQSERAARVWQQHRVVIEPWITATHPGCERDARRITSALLELLAWALPTVDTLEECLTEQMLDRFRRANPNGIGAGSMSNVIGRCRRIFRARAARSDAAEVSQMPTGRGKDDAPGTEASSANVGPYDYATWASIQESAAGDEQVAALYVGPWRRPAVEVWRRARQLAAAVGVDLRQHRVRDSIALQTLLATGEPLGMTLTHLGLSDEAMTRMSAAMPDLPDNEKAALLRGDAILGDPASADDSKSEAIPRTGDCPKAQGEHCAGQPDAHRLMPQPSPHGGAMTNHPHATHSNPTSTSRRRLSRSQARRLRDQVLNGPGERAASFPAETRDYILHKYRPLAPVAERWERLKDPVLQTLAASEIRGEDSLRKHVTCLAYFFAWAEVSGLQPGADAVRRVNLERYTHEVLRHRTKSIRSKHGTQLKGIADQLHPKEKPFKAGSEPYQPIAAPYGQDEMATIRRIAQVQRTPLLKRQMCLLVGLGAGGGIDSTDIKRLRRCDVIDHGPEHGIEVIVTNLRRSKNSTERERGQRTVWILREYEDLVRAGLVDLTAKEPVLGRNDERANVAGNVFDRADLGSEISSLTQGRLRSTWMATHLERATPLNVLLRAAGLTTARTIVELLKHLEEDPKAATFLR